MSRILFVYAGAGPPLEHSLVRIAACGELHLLALKQLPSQGELWRPACASITEAWRPRLAGQAVVDRIVAHARAISADAIMTLSEYAVVAVARSCAALGLPGAGDGVTGTRDKRVMRTIWEREGVPIPRFQTTDSLGDVEQAFDRLRPPLLLKPAWGASSIGQLVLHRQEDASDAWHRAQNAVNRADDDGILELHQADAASDFLVEEILQGSVDSWYDIPGYGDYLSVEGIVARGKYHPICITARIPTIPPFTEMCNIAPCVLPELLQRRIESTARHAVDALGLHTCGTHTEIKLTAGRRPFLIETAARFGGATITREVEDVFGLDLIQMLARELLGQPVDYPDRMLTEGRGAAASVAIIATRSDGTPWKRRLVFDSRQVNWRQLVSAGTTVEIVRGHTVPDGTPIPSYDASEGARNWAGILYLRGQTSTSLLKDCYSVLDNLENALPGQLEEVRNG